MSYDGEGHEDDCRCDACMEYADPGEPEAQEPGGVWLEQRQVETLREAAIHGRSSLFDLVRSALPAEEPNDRP